MLPGYMMAAALPAGTLSFQGERSRITSKPRDKDRFGQGVSGRPGWCGMASWPSCWAGRATRIALRGRATRIALRNSATAYDRQHIARRYSCLLASIPDNRHEVKGARLPNYWLPIC